MSAIFITRGVGSREAQGARAPPPPLNFLKRPKSALFVTKSALFVQTNVAVNINLTSKVPFVSQTYLCMPLTQATYIVNSILTPKAPFLCPKYIAICLTTGCIVAITFML